MPLTTTDNKSKSQPNDSKNGPAPASIRPLDENQLEQLKSQGFTSSLASSLNEVKKNFPLRIWIVDNSGSMHIEDGHRVVDSSSSTLVRMKACSRWEEISSCVEYHMRLASLIEAPTRFRLLNAPTDHAIPSQFSIAEEEQYTNSVSQEKELSDAIGHFRRIGPSGPTPLTRHIHDITDEIRQLAPELQRNGQRVCVTIATDGLPNDNHGSENAEQSFVKSLRGLEGLPVWVVIRLCTDDDAVVSFWNDIDSILELDIDVLDDFTAEATEIREFNPWINYTLPLHRLREFGNHDRLYDLVDERPFTKTEVREFCITLFGESDFDGVADPNLDWRQFLTHLSEIAEKEEKVWNPIQRKPKKWVSVNKLRHRSPLNLISKFLTQ